MSKWLARLVNVHPDEIRRVGGMAALLGLIITTSYVLKPVRSALFLSQVGAENLPYVYVLVAVVLGFVAALFAKWTPRFHLPRLFGFAALFFASNLVVFWVATVSAWPWTGFVFYVWVSIFTALMPSLFWLLANYVFYANEGRRLFPVLMAGGLMGSITGGVVTSVLVRFVGTAGLLLTAALVLVGIAWFLGWNVRHERERISERRNDVQREERSRAIASNDRPWELVTRSRYLMMIATLILLTTMISTLVDYQFNTVVEQSYDSMDALTGFFGAFFASINVVAFVLQLLVVGRLLSRFGVTAGLLVLPTALLASSISFLLVPRLLTAAMIKSADDGLSNSVNKSSVEVLYLPISLAVKNRLKAWLDMFVERASRGLAGLTILGATSILSLSVNQISFVVLALLVPWIALVIALRGEYVETFRESLSRRDIKDLASQLRDGASVSVFRQILAESDERELAYALELLRGVEVPGLVEDVARLTSHDSPVVRGAALRLLRESSDPPPLDDMEQRAHDDDPNAAAEATALWVRLDPEAGRIALRELVGSGDAERIDALLDCLEDDDELVPAGDVEVFVRARWDAKEPSIRRLAARASRFLSDDSPAARHLLELLEDPDVAVARTAAESLGRRRQEGAFEALLQALRRRPLRAAARTALSHYGPDVIDPLLETLESRETPEKLRVALPLVLAQFNDPRVVSALLDFLPQSELRLHYQCVKALNKLRARFPELRFSKSGVNRLLNRERAQLVNLASLHEAAASRRSEHPAHRLLLQVLEERLEFTLERIFRLLGLVYPADELFSAWDRIVSGRPSIRAAALEYLSNVLSIEHRASLLPLLDASSWAELAARGRNLHGQARFRFEEALIRLVRHPDDWLAACAVTLVSELGNELLLRELQTLKDHHDPMVKEAVEAALAAPSSTAARG